MNHRESMEEDDMVMSVGSSLRTERDEPMRRARRLQAEELIRRCQA